MADNTKIEWTDATTIVDRGGRRQRVYRRLDSSRPGRQLRRQMMAQGFKWCRGCKEWLVSASVRKSGLCRTHENEDARTRYATNPEFNLRRRSRSYRRKRGVDPMPPLAAEMVAELFDGECAYCNEPADSWDHVDPVSKGGKTVQGNVVPACTSCNSSKRDSDIGDWLDRAPVVKPFTVEYLSVIGML